LAEEIGQLSNDAVSQTGSITETLTEIHDATNTLSLEVGTLETTLGGKLALLKTDSAAVLETLGEMERELVTLIDKIRSLSGPMRRDIDQLCASVDVHKRIAERSDEVLATLGSIYQTAREHYPATDEFKEDLRRMAEKYTMESERRIHAAISSRHGMQTADFDLPQADQGQESDSEFGDNVDLF
jgi:methyl-accepting chemotaxis protein